MRIKNFLRSVAIVLLFSIGFKVHAQVKHVILISIDGMHPDMYLDKKWPTPNLQRLMKQGTYADYLKSVFPSFTYPSHTAMITGALPARSKIKYNQPIGSSGEWYWYAKDIKALTLWQVLHEHHLTTTALMWPVTVGADIDYDLSELWDPNHEGDRIKIARKYARPENLVGELEQNATGKLDSTNFNDNKALVLDNKVGKMAVYLLKKYQPNFLAMHIIAADDQEHEHGRDADSVRIAMANNDKIIGEVLQAIKDAKLQDNTAVIIVGDHGFATIRQAFRPNALIKDVPAQFVPAGGSAFLYRYANTKKEDKPAIIKAVTDSLNKLPEDKRKLFRIIDQAELRRMGADSASLLALSGTNGSGLVFSGATSPAKVINHGAGTLTQQSPLEGVFYPTKGGHHGFDPDNEEMHTGFIAWGAGIVNHGHIDHLAEPDIAVLITRLLGIEFQTPDGKLIPGIINK